MLLSNILEQSASIGDDGSHEALEWELIGDIAQDLKYSIESGRYTRAAEMLRDLYERMYRVEGDAPDLGRYGIDLAEHKQGIIKGILQYLKDHGMENAILSVSMLQDYYDVKWPELELITRSAMIDRRRKDGLMEQDAREITDILGRMKRRFNRRSFMALKDTIHDMEDIGMHDNAIAAALSTAKPDILAWFEKQFSAGEGRLLTNELIHQVFLLVDIGLMWPELARVLEGNKDTVMRALLQYLQQNAGDNIVLMHIRGYIERFGKLGIRWPELRILWNSVMKELKDQDLDESDSTAEEVPHWFAAIVDYIGDTDIAGAVNMCKTYNVNAKNTPMIANFMESNRWYLLRYLEHCLGMSFQGFDELNRDIKGLRYIGVDWPELDTFYDDNKDKVMRLLLQQVSSHDEDAGYYTWLEINALRQAGVKWPELDIVMKGAMHLMDTKRDVEEGREEYYDDDSRDPAVIWAAQEARFLDGMRNLPNNDVGGLGDLLYGIANHRWTDDDRFEDFVTKLVEEHLADLMKWFVANADDSDVDGIADFVEQIYSRDLLDQDWVINPIRDKLENNKEKIIVWILQKAKNGYDALNEVRNFMRIVDWPELRVIKNSFDKDREVKLSRTLGESSNLLPRKVQNVLDKTLRHVMSGGAYYLYTFERELLAAGASSAMMIDIFNMNKGVILHAIQRDLSTGNVQDGLNGITIVNGVLMEKWPELAESAMANIDRIKAYLADSIGGSGWGYGFGTAVHIYEMLVKTKLDPSMIKELKSYMRDRMLSIVKDLIKNYGFNRQVLDGLESLEKLGVRVDLGAGKMKDKLMSDFSAHLAKDGLSNEGSRFVKLVIKFGNEAANQEMRKVIEDNKAPIVRNMLRMFKVNAAYSVYPILTMLQHLGFKWDELRIIDKTIKSGVLENASV